MTSPKMQALTMAIQAAGSSSAPPGVATAPGGDPLGGQLCVCPSCGYQGASEQFMTDKMEFNPKAPPAPDEDVDMTVPDEKE